jgi:hypothetical protein
MAICAPAPSNRTLRHMPVVKIEPTDEHPVPFSLDEEELPTYMDEVVIAANTAELIESLGAPLEVDEKTIEKEKVLIKSALKGKNREALKSLPVALAASSFVREYGHNLAHDITEVRAALTNKLLEIANCGDTKFELRALELLGKHSDISLFTERSEININYNSPDALEAAIKERVKRLLNAKVIDMPTVSEDLDEELGRYIPSSDNDDEEVIENTEENGE